jgi:hypothetical protein
VPDAKAERARELARAELEAQAVTTAASSNSINSSGSGSSSTQSLTVGTVKDARCKSMPARWQDIGIVADVIPYLDTVVVHQGRGESLLHDR